MRVLLLTVGIIKNIREHDIYQDLLRTFKRFGHEVYVCCTNDICGNKRVKFSIEDGISILRIEMGIQKQSNLIKKGILMLLIERQFINAIKKKYSNVTFDLILYATPPITFANVIKYIKNRDKSLSYLMLKDIFPQNAVDMGMFSLRSPIYKYFRHKEKSLYMLSDYIGCMSRANVDYLLAHNTWVNPECVEVCPNGIEIIEVERKNRNDVRTLYNIPINITVFVYGGNLGKPQSVPFIIDCLKSQMQNTDAYFIIIGSGTEYATLEEFITKYKPVNIILMQSLPSEEYLKLISCCDVGLIFLDHCFTIPNFPSRILSYMQAKLPVIAATDSITDIGDVITKGHFGRWSESNDIEKFGENVRYYIEHKKQVICDGERGFTYLNNHFSSDRCYDIIMKRMVKNEE